MKRGFAFLLILSSVWVGKPYAQSDRKEQQALVVYKEALKLYEYSESTEYTDSLAVSKFIQTSRMLSATRQNARIRFDCYQRIGLLKQTYGLQQEAMAYYNKAIASCLQYKLVDSLLFKPYLYCGMAHFYLHSLDSSIYYLKRAEAIQFKYPTVQEVQRLYNSFGAIYYEAGNYRQSVNYFQKALELNRTNRNANKSDLLFSYKSNIASALQHLEQYNSAITVYKSLISLNINPDRVFINLGATYIKKHNPDSAIYFLKKVSRVDNSSSIILNNTLANAYLQKNQTAQAFNYLRKALAIHRDKQRGKEPLAKNFTIGLTYKLLGDAERQNQNLNRALRYYQQSVIQLDYAFNDTNVLHNPAGAMAGFRSYVLFETLSAKAQCLQQLYGKTHQNQLLTAAMDAYRSTLKLADYIQKSFDTEEARLFMGQKVFPVYQEAVALLIQSYERTKKYEYLEAAFLWADKSKAIALSINLKENDLKSRTGIPDSLLSRERNLKFNLSRLFLKMDNADTDAKSENITAEIRDNELVLSRLINKLNDYPNYRRRKFGFDTVNVATVQRKLLNQRTAILSYFSGATDVYSFVMTRNGIRFYKTRKDSLYQQALRSIKTELQTVVPGAAYRGSAHAQLLYARLIKPVEGDLSGISSLIIIPYDALRLLPFEALEDSQNRYLLEKYDVTYQYAVSFLQQDTQQRLDYNKTLSVAPFNATPHQNKMGFEPLAASYREIQKMTGVKLTGPAATKANFTKLAADASIVHLATHAVANSEDPSRSYIAFYPTDYADYKLYAHELRNEPLLNTQLVFLSACETAGGRVVNGEGVMSLSRAFAYAGCSNVVTSLWKAEDNATASISVRFYAYLKQGYSYSDALRRAKLDLLQDGQYAQFHSPQYWSHLVFIGNPNEVTTPLRLWMLAGSVVLAGTIMVWWVRSKK